MPEPWLKQQLSAEEDLPLRFVLKPKTRITAPKFSVHDVYVPWDFSQAKPKTKAQNRLSS